MTLDGDLTLQTVGAARNRLHELLRSGSAVRLRLAADAQVDLCGVQLVEAARITARALGCEISLAEPARGACLQVLERGGFLHSAEQTAFWLHQ